MARTCIACGADIGHRAPAARFCESNECYNARRHDTKALHAAESLAIQLSKHRIKPTVTRTPIHGWCVRATMPHGPEVYFIDDVDLDFYLAERDKAAA